MADNLYASLKTVFHEPNRLSIVKALAMAPKGLAFLELRDGCNLTNGNLSRHLRVLEEAGAVRIKKSFIGRTPHTQVTLTSQGRRECIDYLGALEDALNELAAAMSPSKDASADGDILAAGALS
jgi:DNA-binding transcriptional ArsR family regulator